MANNSVLLPPQTLESREIRAENAIDTFSRIVHDAVSERKHGQFGLVVSMRDGLIGTLALHRVETVK